MTTKKKFIFFLIIFAKTIDKRKTKLYNLIKIKVDKPKTKETNK